MAQKYNRKLILQKSIIFILIIVVMSLVGCKQETKNGDTVFVDMSEAISIENVEELRIETPYGTIFYPSKWVDNVQIQLKDTTPYTVEFYGQINNKEQIHLFDICFGTDVGYVIGTIEVENQVYNVGICSYDFEEDGTWTPSEILEIYEMQEDVNFLISKMSANETFVFSE